MQCLRQLAIATVIPRALTGRCLSTSTALKMPIKAGDSIPEAELYENNPGTKVNTKDLFKGKSLVVAVPGAFTPTCSNDHIPGYIKNLDQIKGKGVDQVVCISVNDPFVMGAWGESLGAAGKVRMLADPRAEFTKQIDMAFDLTGILGNVRSKRYAMVVENGVVKDVAAEPDNGGLSCSAALEVMKLL